MEPRPISWSVTFGPNGQFVIVTASGTASSEVLLRMVTSMHNQKRWTMGTPVICDFRHLSFLKMTAEEVVGFAKIRKTYSANIGQSPIAKFVKDTEEFEMVRLYRDNLEANHTHAIFRTIEDAVNWISGFCRGDGPLVNTPPDTEPADTIITLRPRTPAIRFSISIPTPIPRKPLNRSS